MKRFATILTALIVVLGLAVAFYLTGGEDWFETEPPVTTTLFDIDADGEVELVRWSLGDSMVLWHWDRDADGQHELVAYDATAAADGTLSPSGQITAWDWGANSVIDSGEVPAQVESFLQQESIATLLAAPPEGEVALVGADIQRLAADIEAGYDEWRLSGFRMPIVGSKLPDLRTLLPGAPRAYRNGVHQGFDFMPGHVGVPTGYSAPAVAAKDGVIIRADVDYVEMTLAEYQAAIATSQGAGATPPDILDKLRGRQVWIDHGAGVVSRYAHLSGVAAGIVAGQRVEGGDIIGFVGNSGTEAGTQGTRNGAHLHYELRIDDRYLGEGLSADDIRVLATRIFGLSE
jgi:murein DD-endopeptidase MepM/ murein hydrolase activator NlpD